MTVKHDMTVEWIKLPQEIWNNIFTFLPTRDVLETSQVCSQFYHILEEPCLWKFYCIRDYRRIQKIEIQNFENPKLYYRHLLKPLGWSVGHLLRVPGGRIVGRVVLKKGAITIEDPTNSDKHYFVKICIEDGTVRVQLDTRGKHVDGQLSEIYSESQVHQLREVMENNIVVFFFDTYMSVDKRLLYPERYISGSRCLS